MLKVGDEAPNCTLHLDDGGSLTLSTQRGTHIILYFYPRDNTPGCTTEARDFTALMPQFEAQHALIVGVSKDGAHSHQCFRKDHALAIKLATDSDMAIARLYGAASEEGKLTRSTFWIGKDGTIKRIWSPVTVAGHAQAVLEALNKERE